MKKLIFLLSILAIFSLIIHGKLVYMSQVYRHGARYPLHDYYDFNQTKQFKGLLTSIGMRQHYLLGSYIQNEYIKSKIPLLNITLKPREVQFFSMITDTARCEQSAYAQILGMFPYGYGEVLPQNIDPNLLLPPFETIYPSQLRSEQVNDIFALEKGFQPTPVRFGMQFFPDCQNINVILSRRGQLISKDLAQFQLQQSAFTDKMRLIFNLTASQANLAGLQQLADTLIADKWLNRQFPTSFTDDDFKQIYYIRGYLLADMYAGQVAQTINSPFINTMIHNMQQKIKGSLNNKKFSSYSVHDLNIIPFLTYYNLTSSDCLKKMYKNQTLTTQCAQPIPFANNLMFQLHQNDSNPDQYYVKVRYNGVYYKLFGKNTTQVEFTQFAQKSKAQLLDFNKQCNTKAIQTIVQ